MSVQKGLCPHCGNSKNIKKNAYTLNDETKLSYCPNCMKKVEPIHAIEHFHSTINKMIHDAEFCLYIKGDAKDAYRQFADVLNVEKNNLDAYYGRIKALINSSTLRETHFLDAADMISNEGVTTFHKIEDKESYLSFLSKANKAGEDYLDIIKKRLVIKGCFYSEECLTLYLTRIKEIVAYKKVLLQEAIYLIKHLKNHKCELLANSITKSIEDYNEYFGKEFKIKNGKIYIFDHVKRNKEVVVKDSGKTFESKVSHFGDVTIDKSNKKARYLKDSVFIQHKNSLTKMLGFFILSICGGICSLLCGSIAYFFNADLISFSTILAIGGASLICFIISIIYYLSLNNYIKKRMAKLSR